MDRGIRERGARKGGDGDFGCGAREGNTIPLAHSSSGTHQLKGVRKGSNFHKRGLETYHQQDSRLSLAHQYPEFMQNGNLKCQL